MFGAQFCAVEMRLRDINDDFGFIWNFRSRSPLPPPSPLQPPSYFRYGFPMHPSLSRRYDPYFDGYFPPMDRLNGHERRYRDRGARITPPSTSARYRR